MSYENIGKPPEDRNKFMSQIYEIDDLTLFKNKRQTVIEKIIACCDWLNDKFDTKNIIKGCTLCWERKNGQIHFYSPENNTIFQYISYGMIFDTRSIITAIKGVFYEYMDTHISSYLYELFLEYESFIYNQSTKRNIHNKCKIVFDNLEKMNEMILCSSNQTSDMITIWNIQYNSLMSCLMKVLDKTIYPLDTTILGFIDEIITLLESGVVTSDMLKNINRFQKYDNFNDAFDIFLWNIPYDMIYEIASNANVIIKNVQKNDYVSYRLKNAIVTTFENIKDSLMRKYVSSFDDAKINNKSEKDISLDHALLTKILNSSL